MRENPILDLRQGQQHFIFADRARCTGRIGHDGGGKIDREFASIGIGRRARFLEYCEFCFPR